MSGIHGSRYPRIELTQGRYAATSCLAIARDTATYSNPCFNRPNISNTDLTRRYPQCAVPGVGLPDAFPLRHALLATPLTVRRDSKSRRRLTSRESNPTTQNPPRILLTAATTSEPGRRAAKRIPYKPAGQGAGRRPPATTDDQGQADSDFLAVSPIRPLSHLSLG